MRLDTKIVDFQELEELLQTSDTLMESLCTLVESMIGKHQGKLISAQTQEDFIRIVYSLDPEMKLPSELLRFLALQFSRFFSQEEVNDFAKELSTLFPFSKINDRQIWLQKLQALCTDRKPDILDNDISVDVEIQHLQDTWEGQIQELAGSEKRHELRKKWLQLHSWAQNKQYFWPELRKASFWTSSQLAKGYKWAQSHHFFWPKIKQQMIRGGQFAHTGYKWLRDKQEIYVFVRSQAGTSGGYRQLLAKKRKKIKFCRRHGDQLAKLYQCPASDFFRMVKGISNLPKISPEQRKPFQQLKDRMLRDQKWMEQLATTHDIINYGQKKWDKVLKKLSRITNRKKINKTLQIFWQALLEQHLQEAAHNFRKQLDLCQQQNDLQRLMSHYPLYRDSLVRNHPHLKIIWKVSNILKDFQKWPDHIDKILLIHLGANGEANVREKIPQILIHSQSNGKIWRAISHEAYLDDLLSKLQQLRTSSSCKTAASSLYRLISVFISGKGKFNFQEFQTSLNFVPAVMQSKISHLVATQLEEELEAGVNTILSKRGKYVSRLSQLQKYFADSRYVGSTIAIFGYPPEELNKMIDSITYQEGKMKKILCHTFTKDAVPVSLLQLIARAKQAERATEEKNIPNCIRILNKITQSIKHRENIHLHKVLVSLFKNNGEVNFASDPNYCTITGYQIADKINRFYLTPNRTTIDIGFEATSEIKVKVETLINEERQRQREKMNI